MASYKIVIVPRGLKNLKNLPQQTADAAVLAIDGLSQNPRPIGCKKLQISEDHWYRIKVKRDYRILYIISDPERVVHVMRVLHRKDAYRSL